MNLILKQLNEKPVLIDNDTNYTRVVKTHDYKVFALYIKGLAKKQIEQTEDVNACLDVY